VWVCGGLGWVSPVCGVFFFFFFVTIVGGLLH